VNVSAIGITPGRTPVNFESGLKKTIPFSIINNEHKDMKVVLRIEGDLAEYVALEQAIVDFSSTEETKNFKYFVSLPKKIEKPGVHTAEIIAMELPKESDRQGYYVGATTAVATQLYVRVPYPGKYAEAKLTIVGGQKENEPVNFYVEVINWGTEDLNDISADVDIFLIDKTLRISTNKKTITAKNKGELAATWIPDEKIPPGVYKAKVRLNYGGNKPAYCEKNFMIGDSSLEIIEIKVDKFKGEQTGFNAIFKIKVESNWNEKITGAYARVFIDTKENEIEFGSSPIDIKPFGREDMFATWNSQKDMKGEYNGKIVLHYNGKTKDNKMKVDIKENSIGVSLIGGRVIGVSGEGFKISKLLIFLVVLLVAINAAWFIYFNKRFKNRKSKTG